MTAAKVVVFPRRDRSVMRNETRGAAASAAWSIGMRAGPTTLRSRLTTRGRFANGQTALLRPSRRKAAISSPTTSCLRLLGLAVVRRARGLDERGLGVPWIEHELAVVSRFDMRSAHD